MHRIDTTTSQDGKFVNGNANQNVKGTQVDADWLNAIQEEICYLIEHSGQTLNKASTKQVSQSIERMMNNFPKRVIIDKSANVAASSAKNFVVISSGLDYSTYDMTIVVNNRTENTGTFSVKVIDTIDNSVVKEIEFPMTSVAILTKRAVFVNDVTEHPSVKLVVSVSGAANLSYSINGSNTNF